MALPGGNLRSIPSQNLMKNLMLISFLKVLYSIIGSSFLDYFFLNMKTWTLFSGIDFLKKNPHFSYNFEYLLCATPCIWCFNRNFI